VPEYAEPEILKNPVRRTHDPESDYGLVPLGSLRALRDRPGTVLAYEVYPPGEAAPDGRIGVVFADGHVERLPREEFERALGRTLRAAPPRESRRPPATAPDQ
jgi:prepilin-type processing-associated H-X9-DG protein